MVIGLERNVLHGGGCAAALDNNTGRVSLPRERENRFAQQEIVHAQDQRRSSTEA